MKTALVVLLACAGLMSAGTARAQYGGAPIITPPGQRGTDVNGITNRFRDVYQSHGRPRIVIFWNRDFGTQVATAYDNVDSKEKQSRDKSVMLQQSASSLEGSTTLTKREGGLDTRTEYRSGIRQVGPDAAGTLDSQDTATWEAQSAFIDSLSAIPARLIDRATIMRTSADAINAGNQANIQAIETKALMDKADLILETGVNSDRASQSGYVFKVAVRDIKTGEILTQFTTHAVPLEARQIHFTAGPEGYVRTQIPMTLGMVGRELAIETMQKLSQAW